MKEAIKVTRVLSGGPPSEETSIPEPGEETQTNRGETTREKAEIGKPRAASPEETGPAHVLICNF